MVLVCTGWRGVLSQHPHPSMPSPRSRPESPATEYVYRRQPEPRELLPALGAALGVGLAVFYVARLFIQRTSLIADGSPDEPRSPRAGHG